jgi:hypothetical protein
MKVTQQVWAYQIRVGDVLAMPYIDGDGDMSVTIETVTSVTENHDPLRVPTNTITFETTYRFPGMDGPGTMTYRNKDRYEGYTILNGGSAHNVRQTRSAQAHRAFMGSLS